MFSYLNVSYFMPPKMEPDTTLLNIYSNFVKFLFRCSVIKPISINLFSSSILMPLSSVITVATSGSCYRLTISILGRKAVSFILTSASPSLSRLALVMDFELSSLPAYIRVMRYPKYTVSMIDMSMVKTPPTLLPNFS